MSGLTDADLTPSEKDVEIDAVSAACGSDLHGQLFVLRPGREKNGAADILSCAEALGASALLYGAYLDLGEYKPKIPTVLTEDVRGGESRLCAALYAENAPLDLVAVTGTNGKTTTASMLHHILAECGIRVGIVGTLGAEFEGTQYDADEMTTPAPEIFYKILGDMCRRGAKAVVFEASSQGILQRRLEGLHVMKSSRMRSAVFTNLSPEHLDAHGTMEEYFRVKSSLFEDYAAGCAIINTDDAYGHRLYDKISGVSVGSGDGCEYKVYGISSSFGRTSYRLRAYGKSYSAECAGGIYNAYNSAYAIAASHAFGVDTESAVRALYSFEGVRGRMERVKLPEAFPAEIYIDFAHTPDAIRELLTSARVMYPEKRLIVLFGCGGERDRAKRPLMGRIAVTLADFVIITSDNSRGEDKRDIINDILSGVKGYTNYTVIEDRKEAIYFAVGSAKAGDLIILAGKGHESYEISGGAKWAFDERTVASEAARGARPRK